MELHGSLVEEHKLITEGPYRLVRNPIYTGMLGILIVTGLAISRWFAVVAALVLFGIGTVIRVRSEEKLLREAFGAEFDAYARRVPAVFPRPYSNRHALARLPLHRFTIRFRLDGSRHQLGRLPGALSRAAALSVEFQWAREKCSCTTRQFFPSRAKTCVPRPRTLRPLPSPTVQ